MVLVGVIGVLMLSKSLIGLVSENKVQMVGLDLSLIHILGMGWL